MLISELLNRAEEQLASSRPFVLYRNPKDSNVNGVFQNTDNVYTSNDYDDHGFIFAPFSGYENALTIPFSNADVVYVRYNNTSYSKKEESSPTFKASEKDNHLKLVNKAVSTITTTTLEKVVLSRIHKATTEKSALGIYQDLLDTYANAFVYLWYHPKTGIWLGATPETLLTIKGQHFKTMSLAGTKENLEEHTGHWSSKEVEEQAIVTRAIVNNLKEVSTSIDSSKTETTSAGNLLHLKTIITGSLKYNFKLKDIIKQLHPTPAVCGMPRELSKNFIAANEYYERTFYTGFLGIVKQTSQRRKNVENLAYRRSRLQANLFVNLRCLSLQDGEAKLYVGGGITIDSNPEDEFQETLNKAKTMLKVL